MLDYDTLSIALTVAAGVFFIFWYLFLICLLIGLVVGAVRFLWKHRYASLAFLIAVGAYKLFLWLGWHERAVNAIAFVWFTGEILLIKAILFFLRETGIGEELQESFDEYNKNSPTSDPNVPNGYINGHRVDIARAMGIHTTGKW